MARNTQHPRLADPGSLLSKSYRLDDGERVRLRLTRPSDAGRVDAFLARLSPETLHRRFFAPKRFMPARAVRHFTFYDPRLRLVVAAAAPGEGGEEIVGLADASFLETGLVEIGLVVEDERQGRGIGRVMSEAIASLAIQRGATHLKAELVDGNGAVLSLLESLGRSMQTFEDGKSVVYTRLPGGRRAAA
jgi:GNAT superfamily N-acetyltransferase